MGKPVTITLCVSASALYNANPQPSTQPELDVYCVLSDDNGGVVTPAGSSVNNFTSQVYGGNTITWVGQNCGSDGYRVLIDSISDTGDFFASDPPGSDGRVTVTLNDPISGADTYTITFTIDSPGNPTQFPPKQYVLDPKLGGNPH